MAPPLQSERNSDSFSCTTTPSAPGPCGTPPTLSHRSPPCSRNSSHAGHRPSSFSPQSLCTCCSLYLTYFPPALPMRAPPHPPGPPLSDSLFLPQSATSLIEHCLCAVAFWVISFIFPIAPRGSGRVGSSEWSHSKNLYPHPEKSQLIS